ncbi:hypothetical protein MNBD_GAMMA17-2223 [hydrothermal vent metagenome]|uniref:Uncharacterized protein n=1 Tax=hydrothermal vent metagenome TaxID=652676 RepID=A0A3B0Z6B2_9ZZZZ
MTIEVRQLVIKSSVQSEAAVASNEQQLIETIAALRDELMSECREMVSECVRDNAER